VQEAYYTDGAMAHQRVYTARRGLLAETTGNEPHEAMCAEFLQDALTNKQRSVMDLRERFLAWEYDFGFEEDEYEEEE